ncbi:hypothetical protein AVEN_227346-1 [Araneus ventricosus]|uniref:Uncharacterized protein n=1 Tax=Araneus ventricosus TaxID=182803 RepID=A0A4Y2GVE3_ARAVE|nr:hypothetical protein AVEN_227346-1 [Araneus ventricosus]
MTSREDPSCLGEYNEIALKRLNSLWKRLKGDPVYLTLYKAVLREYEALSHMNEVTDEESQVAYHMPHRGVYRPEKATTKLRTVFNASSPTTRGQSLNSIQCNGGMVKEELFLIMVRFHKHYFAFITDIEKIQRMINMHPNQRSMIRIHWKNCLEEHVKTRQLATVTYGTVSASCLETRTLKQLSIDEK